jgi:hypothetical protein
MVGGTIGSGVDEHKWIQDYVAARKRWLSGLNPPLPKTVYRMEAFASLIAGGKWDLPLALTVRGAVISMETLSDASTVVRAAAVDPADPPAPAILFVKTPYMRGEEVRRVQEALNTAGFANSRATACTVRSPKRSSGNFKPPDR